MKNAAPKPLYAQIKDYILYKINSGELGVHDRIPSERVLSEQFGVSRLTASKAIKELVMEGKLHTQVGKGTFVSDTPIDQTLDRLTSFSEEMEKRGQTPGSRIIAARQIPAPLTVAQALHLAEGAPVVMLKRVRLANGQPVGLETAYLTAHYCQNILEDFDFTRQSLYVILRQHYNLRIHYANQEFASRLATEEEARLLQLEPIGPVLSIQRVTFLESDTPIEYVESAYRGDRYKFRARLLQR